MANKDLLVGSIVKLSPKTNWPLTEANPRLMAGEVLQIRDWIVVKWLNGRQNSYLREDTDLILIESP